MMEVIDPRIITLHAKISWWILDCKYLYYEMDESPVPDLLYDRIEKVYERLCHTLGEQPTATDMVGFDRERPCCQQVRAAFIAGRNIDLNKKAEEFILAAEQLGVATDMTGVPNATDQVQSG